MCPPIAIDTADPAARRRGSRSRDNDAHGYLEALVDSKRREDRTIEYKAALPGRDSKGSVEFLKDISAMANASGGELIFGIEEER